MRRPLGILLAAVALTVGVVSASTFGSFPEIAFSAFAEERVPCTEEDVTLLDDTVLGGALDLIAGTILPSSELTAVDLNNLSGDCVGMVPVVVVYGIDLTDLAAGEQRLFTLDQFDPLVSNDDVRLSVDPPITLGDGLTEVFYTLTETRVAYCPDGVPCT